MVADAQGAGRWANWAAERKPPRWIGFLANAALVLAVLGSAIGFPFMIWLESTWGWRAAVMVPGVIALLAIYVRATCPESPYWVRTQDRKRRTPPHSPPAAS